MSKGCILSNFKKDKAKRFHPSIFVIRYSAVLRFAFYFRAVSYESAAKGGFLPTPGRERLSSVSLITFSPTQRHARPPHCKPCPLRFALCPLRQQGSSDGSRQLTLGGNLYGLSDFSLYRFNDADISGDAAGHHNRGL